MNALVTIAEFAELTGRHRTTISRWLDSGELESVTYGGKRYIPRRAVEELLGTVAA